MVLEQYIKVVAFTSGERLAIFHQIRDIATRRGLPAVAARAERGLVHDRRTRELDNRWAKRSGGRIYAETVTEIDNLVDPVLTSIRDIARSHTRALPLGHELTVQVESMLKDIFPAGVMAVVSLPYVDQVAATEVVLDKLQNEHLALVTRLGLMERVQYLAELTAAYREAVDQDSNLSFAIVRASRATGQCLLRELIAQILGMFSESSDPDAVARRNELLEPVNQQTRRAQLRRARRRGRTVEDEILDPLDEDEDVLDEDVLDEDVLDEDVLDEDVLDEGVLDEDVLDEERAELFLHADEAGRGDDRA